MIFVNRELNEAWYQGTLSATIAGGMAAASGACDNKMARVIQLWRPGGLLICTDTLCIIVFMRENLSRYLFSYVSNGTQKTRSALAGSLTEA